LQARVAQVLAYVQEALGASPAAGAGGVPSDTPPAPSARPSRSEPAPRPAKPRIILP
jgi:hypothetical protein